MNRHLEHYKLGTLCSVKHGYPFDGSKFADHGTYIVLTPGNFFEKGGFKRIKGKEKYYTGAFPQEYLCSKDDLIVAMTQQAEGLLGSTALVPEDNLYLHNQRIGLVFHNHDLVDKLYLYYLFMTKSVRKQISDSASGTKIKHTSPDKIYSVSVSIPSIDIQRKNALLLYWIDKKIENNSLICSELEAIGKTLYDYWFVQFDFPDENGRPYRTSGGEMVWNEQLKRKIPKGWAVGKIGQLGSIVSGGTPTTTCADYYCDNGFAWITPNDLSGNGEKMFVSHGERDITQAGIDSSSAVLMPKHSVLLSTRAPIGYLAISDNEVCTNQGFKSIIPDAGYHEYYIYYLLKRNIPAISRQGVGTTFKEVSKETLSDFKLPLPPKPIANEFANAVSSLCENRCVLEKENEELTKLRDWLLPMLMNGQARVE